MPRLQRFAHSFRFLPFSRGIKATSKSKGPSVKQAVPLQFGMADMGKYEDRIKALQQALLEHGFNPGKADGIIGLGTQATVLAFQRSEGLLADGVAGARRLVNGGSLGLDRLIDAYQTGIRPTA